MYSFKNSYPNNTPNETIIKPYAVAHLTEKVVIYASEKPKHSRIPSPAYNIKATNLAKAFLYSLFFLHI